VNSLVLVNQEINSTDVERVQQPDVNGVVQFRNWPKASHKFFNRRLINTRKLHELFDLA
jgi:hypothetical protein